MLCARRDTHNGREHDALIGNRREHKQEELEYIQERQTRLSVIETCPGSTVVPFTPKKKSSRDNLAEIFIYPRSVFFITIFIRILFSSLAEASAAAICIRQNVGLPVEGGGYLLGCLMRWDERRGYDMFVPSSFN